MMFEHFKGDEIFVRKIVDYKNQALDHQRFILTPFLNPHQQEIAQSVIGKQDVCIYFYGGFENSENKRAVICPDFYEINQSDFKVCTVKINYNKQFGQLKHKDVLGALMNLGIKRECIGDIYDKDDLYFSCLEQNYSYIRDNLRQIKKSKIHLQCIDEKITIEHDYTSKTFFVSSFRLDNVVATLYAVSRKEASRFILAGHVKVNHKMIEEVNYLCHNGDIISFKRHGRVVLKDEGKKTKANNHVVSGLFYK